MNEGKEYKQILVEFIELIRSHKKITIYHYGSYETKFFRLLTNTFPESGTVKRIVGNSVNVLSLIYPSIYFPTYSNGLKDIAKYLGFKWLEGDLTGLESILLRKKWELTEKSSLKTSLVNYNIDDCFALRIVTNFLIAITSNESKSEFPKIQITDDFRDEIRARYGGHKFEVPDFILDNFDYINKCSYFDYQRSKIFFKTDSKIKKANNRNDKRKTKFPKTHNTEVNIRKHSKCPRCKSENIRIAAKVDSKIVVDIKFFKGGIKKWITKYNSQRHQCRDCLKSYFPNRYKNIGVKYGHNLISWVVSQHIVNGISFGKIERNLADYFQISVGSVGGESLYRFKTLAANYYKREYNSLLAKIKTWKNIHVDETRVRVQGLSGYIWVFTDMANVVFIYTEKRKTAFISSLIKGTKGVLVTDFYKGYEAMECPQQKCLVHLIRDINDYLFKYQQNEELKIMAQKFSSLLKLIVDTSKKYGLKKRYLLKHKKDVLKFYDFLRNTTFESDVVKKIEKRFIKFENQLFTFLDYDGVPWNNNNAEHAFKHFASYRRNTNGIFTENGLKNYLILLSIYQTCSYRNIDFLKFLLSKEKHIDIYEKKYTRNGNLRKGCRPHSSIY
ncbi:MAG: transposase [Cyclobacteriaceae bacterium]